MIPEYTKRPDEKTGLMMVRYCGRWCVWVYAWGTHPESAIAFKIDGTTTDLPFTKGGKIRLPDGRYTANYYH